MEEGEKGRKNWSNKIPTMTHLRPFLFSSLKIPEIASKILLSFITPYFFMTLRICRGARKVFEGHSY